MKAAPAIRLSLFFTRGIFLRTWDERGIFEREAALFRTLQRKGAQVTFITCGDRRDLLYGDRLDGIRVRSNRWRLPSRHYNRFLPLLHAPAFIRNAIVRTNQFDGADLAIHSCRFWHTPLIVRGGYMLSEFAMREHGADSPEARSALAAEGRAFRAAQRIVVTTEAMRANIAERFPQIESRIAIIPNYVDTERFRPDDAVQREKRRLVYVGRIEDTQKNLRALIEALRDCDAQLDLIGDGPLRATLERETRDIPNIRFVGIVPHENLPQHLLEASALILPSHYEGHPKALFEAMACGTPVIASDAPGIRESIEHERTGILVRTDVRSIRQGIDRLLDDAATQQRIGEAGRRFVQSHCSLDAVADLEIRLYRQVLAQHGDSP